MTPTDYRRLRDADLRASRPLARTLHTIGNVVGEIPPGSLVRIDGKHGGLSLRTEPCDACGLVLRISHVQPSAIELVS